MKGQYMNGSPFWMIKYMNGSVFSNARYMNGLGSEILIHKPVPELPSSYLPPHTHTTTHPPPPTKPRAAETAHDQ